MNGSLNKFLTTVTVLVVSPFSTGSERLRSIIRKVRLVGVEALVKIKYPFIAVGKFMQFFMPLSKHSVRLRRGSIDIDVFKYVFYDQYHKPINEVELGSSPLILDMGANIGLSVLTFKHWYPGSKILAFEMDRDNYELALYNTKGLRDVFFFNCAISAKSGVVEYEKTGREDGYAIGNKEAGSEYVSVKSFSVGEVIHDNDIEIVDFLKMDIEGAEIEILQSDDLSWMQSVKNIAIEFHLQDDDILKYIKIMEKQGFRVYTHKDHVSSLTGVNMSYRNVVN